MGNLLSVEDWKGTSSINSGLSISTFDYTEGSWRLKYLDMFTVDGLRTWISTAVWSSDFDEQLIVITHL
jgi:hypothetical protein